MLFFFGAHSDSGARMSSSSQGESGAVRGGLKESVMNGNISVMRLCPPFHSLSRHGAVSKADAKLIETKIGCVSRTVKTVTVGALRVDLIPTTTSVGLGSLNHCPSTSGRH